MSLYEFDTAYSAVTGEHVGGHYIPTVENDDRHDILIDGRPTRAAGSPWRSDDVHPEWDTLTGYTGQDGYSGAVMHASESPTDEQIREWVREAGGDVFAIVAVETAHDDVCDGSCDGEECDSWESAGAAGWAVIYREASA